MATKPKAPAKSKVKYWFYKSAFNFNTPEEKIASLSCVIGPLNVKEGVISPNQSLYLTMNVYFSQEGNPVQLDKIYEYWYGGSPNLRKPFKEKLSSGSLWIGRQIKWDISSFMAEFTRAEAELAALIPQSL